MHHFPTESCQVSSILTMELENRVFTDMVFCGNLVKGDKTFTKTEVVCASRPINVIGSKVLPRLFDK